MISLQQLFTISNFFSFARLVLAIPMFIAISQNYSNKYVYLLGLIAYATDLLDGYLARKLNQITEWGKILDPLADKVFIAGVCFAMVLSGQLPIWYIAIVIGRDVLIVIASLIVSAKTSFVLPSTFVGKATVFSIGISLLCSYAFDNTVLLMVLYIISIAMIAFSLWHYGSRMNFSIRKPN